MSLWQHYDKVITRMHADICRLIEEKAEIEACVEDLIAIRDQARAVHATGAACYNDTRTSVDRKKLSDLGLMVKESYKTIPSEFNGSEEEDREMYEHPNPLAEWKALKPGRKVLNKFSKRVWSIVSFSERDNCYQLVDPENKEVGTSLGSSQEDFENNYQILHEGPFDAGKLQPGDWLWDEHYRQWVQFKEIASDGLIGIISRGINYYVNPYNPNLYFTPPSRGVYKYEIDSPDELDAGLHGFRDEVTVIVDSGEPGGDPTGEDSFEEYMRQALIEWYDGAGVMLKKAGE